MAKFISVIFILLIGTALGSPARRPEDGVVKELPRNVEPYIIGGEKVSGRAFPGMVSLQLNGSHICGGSIVNENYILTAAHCFKGMTRALELSALSGTNNLKTGGASHGVTDIYYHEQYDPAQSWHNDVAVLKVDSPFVFDADHNTAPVTLPAQSETTPVGAKATVIGWGEDSIRDSSDDLYEVDISVWDQTLCDQTYEPYGFKVYPEQMCANTPEGGKGSCQGDDGGPLLVNGEVVGIVSWALGCSMNGYPTIYTRVSAYRDWINTKISA